MPVRLIVCVPAILEDRRWSAIGSSVGAWLTGVTVTLKVCVKVLTPPLAVPPLSVHGDGDRRRAAGVGHRACR